ncbi:MAG TPA: class I SAM-dependent methyltransferase [Acidimicrobiales bacterium]|jgi:SAM-dependent methyltransferase
MTLADPFDGLDETARLEAVAAGYDPSNPEDEFDYFTKRLHVEVIGPWLHGEHVLEMGCATGELTSLMAPKAQRYDVVEGSSLNVKAAESRVPTARFFTELWEDFIPADSYSDILHVCALEHVAEPVPVLQRAASWLRPGGRLHVVVPNADSLHRLVGVEMGILSHRAELSTSDHRIGHRRVYDLDALRRDVEAAGLRPLHWQGIFLKALSNSQMLGWDWSLIRALHAVGQRFPAHCAELYVVAERA